LHALKLLINVQSEPKLNSYVEFNIIASQLSFLKHNHSYLLFLFFTYIVFQNLIFTIILIQHNFGRRQSREVDGDDIQFSKTSGNMNKEKFLRRLQIFYFIC